MSTSNPVAAAIMQLRDGDDFWSVDDLTRDLSPEQACRVVEGTPYSIAGQVGHMLCWQDRWIDQVQGQPVPEHVTDEQDFPTITQDQWMEVRARLVAGIEVAYGAAMAVDLERPVGSGKFKSGDVLLGVAVHGAYHIGQIALLRQVAGYGMPTYATEG